MYIVNDKQTVREITNKLLVKIFFNLFRNVDLIFSFFCLIF